jgi:hypothetical protein
VWGNSGEELVVEAVDGDRVTFSCIGDGEIWPGDGNFGGDPRFCLPGSWEDGGTPDDFTDDRWVEGDYRLRPDSPCIGAGEGGKDVGADLGLCSSVLARFQRGDVDADEHIDLTDAVFTLSFLFLGGPQPPEPFGECVVDPTFDQLTCAEFSPCAQ